MRGQEESLSTDFTSFISRDCYTMALTDLTGLPELIRHILSDSSLNYFLLSKINQVRLFHCSCQDEFELSSSLRTVWKRALHGCETTEGPIGTRAWRWR